MKTMITLLTVAAISCPPANLFAAVQARAAAPHFGAKFTGFVSKLPGNQRLAVLNYLSGRVSVDDYTVSVQHSTVFRQPDPHWSNENATLLERLSTASELHVLDPETTQRLELALKVLRNELELGSELRKIAGDLHRITEAYELYRRELAALNLAETQARILNPENNSPRYVDGMFDRTKRQLLMKTEVLLGPRALHNASALSGDHQTKIDLFIRKTSLDLDQRIGAEALARRFPWLYPMIKEVLIAHRGAPTFAEFAAAIGEFRRGLLENLRRTKKLSEGSVSGFIRDFLLTRDSRGKFADDTDRMMKAFLLLDDGSVRAAIARERIALDGFGETSMHEFMDRLISAIRFPQLRYIDPDRAILIARGRNAIAVLERIAALDFGRDLSQGRIGAQALSRLSDMYRIEPQPAEWGRLGRVLARLQDLRTSADGRYLSVSPKDVRRWFPFVEVFTDGVWKRLPDSNDVVETLVVGGWLFTRDQNGRVRIWSLNKRDFKESKGEQWFHSGVAALKATEREVIVPYLEPGSRFLSGYFSLTPDRFNNPRDMIAGEEFFRFKRNPSYVTATGHPWEWMRLEAVSTMKRPGT